MSFATAATYSDKFKNKTLQKDTSINNKNSQSSNVHAKVTSPLQFSAIQDDGRRSDRKN